MSRTFFTFSVFAMIRPMITKLTHTHTHTKTETDKATAIGEIADLNKNGRIWR